MGSDAPAKPGDILLGKYRVERILGQGGMGIVVAARHLDLDELFAIKLMLPSGLASSEAVERFLREARAAAKLKGDHVAKVQDVGRLPDGTPYMIMEHLEGTDLRSLVRERGRLSPSDAVTYVLQACETLREAHALGIVHRDVKSANLFLTHRPNGTPCIKVLDFGISKQTKSDTSLTTTALVGGSPLYMSPEQMRSAKYVDHRTDVWAVGIVLHELLTGMTPFHAESITAVAGRVLQDEPEPPGRIRGDVPPWLDAVILRCLVKHPDGRFQSMAELMAALSGATPAFAGGAAQTGTSARPPQPGASYAPPALAGGSFAPPAPVAPSPATMAAPVLAPTVPMTPMSPPGASALSGSTTAGFSQVANAVPVAAPTPVSPLRTSVFVAASGGALALLLGGAIWALAREPEPPEPAAIDIPAPSMNTGSVPPVPSTDVSPTPTSLPSAEPGAAPTAMPSADTPAPSTAAPAAPPRPKTGGSSAKPGPKTTGAPPASSTTKKPRTLY